ncbi:MAG: HAD-IA family hydrolase [Limnospira sp.]
MRDRTPITIIFDFDGTLADTLDVIVTITNDLAEEFGYPAVEYDDVTELQNMSSWDIIRRSGVSIFKIPKLLRRVREELRDNLSAIALFPGVLRAILDLKYEGYKLYIITSNSKENVELVLKQEGVLEQFDGICSESSLFGKHHIINRLIEREKIDKRYAIYMGDETRDIDAAKKAKVNSVAVTWGFNSVDSLVKHHPDRIIDSPDDIPAVVLSFLLLR